MAPGIASDSRADRTLRVAYISMHTSPLASPGSADAGGMNVVELNSALAMGRRGHQIELITRCDDPSLPEIVDVGEGVRVVNLRAGEPRSYAKSAQEELIAPFEAALREYLLRGDRPDLIHSHHWFSGVAALPVARELGVPHVQTYHSVAAPEGADLSAGEVPESPGRRPGERLTAQQSDLVIAVSEAEKRYICERYGLACDSIAVVHPGVDVDQFRPLAPDEPKRLVHGDRYLFFAARLQPLKGPDLAIETLAGLPADLRPRLVIAGAVSADFADYYDELLARVARFGLQDRVTFLGSQNRDQLAARLRSAELLIMPSYSETFGLIALEAEASGIPVIATHAGGLPEAVIDGQTGILLETREPAAWASAVAGLLHDDHARAAMGAAAREHALGLTWDHTVAGLEAAYRTLIEPT